MNIILSDLNLTYTKKELQTFHKLWKKGYDIIAVSEHLNREIDELALLVMDLASKQCIGRRSNGLDWSKEKPKHEHQETRMELILESIEGYYYCLEGRKFIWGNNELFSFIDYWNANLHLSEIASELNVDINDAALLLMHLTRKKLVSPRKGGLEGEKCKSKAVSNNHPI